MANSYGNFTPGMRVIGVDFDYVGELLAATAAFLYVETAGAGVVVLDRSLVYSDDRGYVMLLCNGSRASHYWRTPEAALAPPPPPDPTRLLARPALASPA